MAFGNRLINTNAGAASLSVGDYVGGGIVFYVNPDNDAEALVVDIVDTGNNRWHTGYASIPTSTAIGTGLSNTEIAVAINGTFGIPYACLSLVKYGFSDWYLPSKDEQQQIFNNLSTINAACVSNGGAAFDANKYYDTSSQGTNYTNVWGNDGGTGSSGLNDKYAVAAYRAVRTYTPYPTIQLGQYWNNEGIVVYVNPFNTRGVILAMNNVNSNTWNWGSTPLASTMGNVFGSYFDSPANSDAIIAHMGTSTNYAVNQARAYGDGSWDLPNAAVLGAFMAKYSTLNSQFAANGGTSMAGQFWSAQFYDQYNSPRSFYVNNNTSQLDSVGTGRLVRASKNITTIV